MSKIIPKGKRGIIDEKVYQVFSRVQKSQEQKHNKKWESKKKTAI